MTRFARIEFDSVAPLYPSDKVAGRVAARGEHFEFTPSKIGKVHSDVPLPVRRPDEKELRYPNFIDLTGIKIGRFSVLGIAANYQSTNGQNWVVRCVCGIYETRKAKYIKACAAGNNPGDHEPMCDCCSYTGRLQRGQHNAKKAAAAAQAITEAAR